MKMAYIILIVMLSSLEIQIFEDWSTLIFNLLILYCINDIIEGIIVFKKIKWRIVNVVPNVIRLM